MIRHINKVEVCEAYHLGLATPLPDGLHVVINDYMPFRPLPLVGLAAVEVTDELTNRMRVWTTKVTARLSNLFLLPACPVVFRLTDVCGRHYLVGTALFPFPKVNFSDKFPDQPAGISGCNLLVTWKSTSPMMEIISNS